MKAYIFIWFALSDYSLIRCVPSATNLPQTKEQTNKNTNKLLTPVAHLAYITPFHSPSMEQKDFLSLGALQDK